MCRLHIYFLVNMSVFIRTIIFSELRPWIFSSPTHWQKVIQSYDLNGRCLTCWMVFLARGGRFISSSCCCLSSSSILSLSPSGMMLSQDLPVEKFNLHKLGTHTIQILVGSFLSSDTHPTKIYIKEQGTNWTGTARLAQNRVRWRGVVDSLCSSKGYRPM